MSDFKIRAVDAATFATAIDWAADEGWEPGLDDLAAFHAADPDGFLMGFVGDTPVSSISVVNYDDTYGFLGFYIVHPDYRGKGYGIATWEAGMAYLQGCTVGLDGVVAQQDNYRKSGFALAGRNVRHSGVPVRLGNGDAGCTIRPVAPDDIPSLLDYDALHVPARRDVFMGVWISPKPTRQSLIAVRDDTLCGVGTMRTCRTGNKIGPLFAADAAIAEALFDALIALIPAGAEVSLDTPEDNATAVAIATRAGLKPVFETARMYRGPAPDLPLAKIFGITTFELG